MITHLVGNISASDEMHYNTTLHSTTGFSPFQIVYSRPPPIISQHLLGTVKLEANDTFFTTKEEV